MNRKRNHYAVLELNANNQKYSEKEKIVTQDRSDSV